MLNIKSPSSLALKSAVLMSLAMSVLGVPFAVASDT